jgi:hypothetical protein
MKNKIKIIIALAGVVSFYACNDSLITDKPQSALTQVDFFTTPIRINDGVMGCYQGMANIQDDEWRYTEIRSDNTCVSSVNTGTTDRADICDLKFFRTSPSQTGLLSFWYKIFQNISNVNAILPNVAPGKTFVPIEAQRAQYEGELLFMRAYHYYTLVNLWGDMFKVTTVIGPDEAKTIPRSPVSEIYDQIIIPDLIKASNELPDSYSTTDVGRITKWAAKSMLAKAYMMIGGDANLTLAKGLLEEVLASPQYHLLTTGITVGGKLLSPYASIFDVNNEMNPEIIFAIRYKGGSFGIGSPFWGTFAPEGSSNIILKIGTPLGNNNPTPDIMKVLKTDSVTDTRIDACFRIWKKSATSNVPYISKYIDPNITIALQGENDWIQIRYADIILLHAEIAAQQNDYVTALNDVNKIRARAGVHPYISFSSKNEALDSVYTERRKEFAFENQRWYDLLRMGNAYGDPNKAISILTTSIFVTDWTALYSLYTPILPPTQSNFTTNRLLLPIPQQEIDTNNKMVIPQNPSY